MKNLVIDVPARVNIPDNMSIFDLVTLADVNGYELKINVVPRYNTIQELVALCIYNRKSCFPIRVRWPT